MLARFAVFWQVGNVTKLKYFGLARLQDCEFFGGFKEKRWLDYEKKCGI